MKVLIQLLIFCLALHGFSLGHAAPLKRLLVVDSYHQGDFWSLETHTGFNAAMLELGYFDNREQVDLLDHSDSIATSRAIIKKVWLDSKRQPGKMAREANSAAIYRIAREFRPDLIFLGDDDAAAFVGRGFLDTGIPMVFWGINNTPLKYGLVDSMENPGHNATGVFQSGYYLESLELLKKIKPEIETFAILSDGSTTGRAQYKAIERLAHKGVLPVRLVETVATNSYEEWQAGSLALQRQVDGFYVVQYATLIDREGKVVPEEEAARWYLDNIRIPEATMEARVKRHGLLCSAADSGYNQGYEAVLMAHDILFRGKEPATLPPRTPKRGPLIVHRQRAEMLGLTLTPEMGIEEVIDAAGAEKR